jgi:hypothetical protein
MAASNPLRRQEFYSGRELFPERLARELFAEKQQQLKLQVSFADKEHDG